LGVADGFGPADFLDVRVGFDTSGVASGRAASASDVFDAVASGAVASAASGFISGRPGLGTSRGPGFASGFVVGVFVFFVVINRS
jgi:hypothetical protein